MHDPAGFTRAQMREMDRRAVTEFGLTIAALMEAAGGAVARAVLADSGGALRAVVLCGRGNNGGDGLVAARYLANAGLQVQVILLAPAEQYNGDAGRQLYTVQAMQLPVASAEGCDVQAACEGAVCVDAIFGAGLNRPVTGLAQRVISQLTAATPARVFAVDVPSGLDCDTGQPLGAAVRAHTTVTFCGTKRGFAAAGAAAYTGKIIVADIGMPAVLLRARPTRPSRTIDEAAFREYEIAVHRYAQALPARVRPFFYFLLGGNNEQANGSAAIVVLRVAGGGRAPAGAAVHGFSAFAPPHVAGAKKAGYRRQRTFVLTDGKHHEAVSGFCRTPQNITSFKAAFTYRASTVGKTPKPRGDGLTFVLQNDPRGVHALAGVGKTISGKRLGYGGQRGLRKSFALEINLLKGNSGIALHSGAATGIYVPTAPVSVRSGHPIRITLSYNGLMLREHLKDLRTGKTFSAAAPADIPGAVGGNTALVGFTAASGDNAALQQVSDFSFTAGRPFPQKVRALAGYVMPIIGTGGGPGGPINCFPGPSRPFGMVQCSPDTDDTGYGYHYYNNTINDFSMTHMSGVGCNDEGDVAFMPTTGAIHTRMANFRSRYSHAHEAMSAGYYRVRLLRWNVVAELTATDRCGMARFTFPAGKRANVLLPISHTLNYTAGAHLRIINHTQVQGYVIDHCFCGNRQPYTVYFVMQFSKPFQRFGTWKGSGAGKKGKGTIHANTRTVTQNQPQHWVGGYVSWPATAGKQVVYARIGISYVSLADARQNLAAEIAGRTAGAAAFTQVQAKAVHAWNKTLGAIRVSGGTPAQKAIFYTSLYQSCLMPSIYSDVNGKYMGFDNKVHTVAPGRLQYADFSGWDIYRSEMSLLALIQPRRVADMCQSIVLMYKQGGWIDRWPQVNHYTNVMCGSPLTTIMCMAWDYGIHNFDIQTGWQGMVKDAITAPPPGKPYHGQNNIKYINKLHFDPDNHEGYGSVSQIQEDCVAYAALYHLAKRLDKPADRKLFYKRALYYRNVFDHSDRCMRPRNSDGTWRKPFVPTQQHGYVEGTGWHYQWLVPADMAWLVHAVGRARFNRRLSAFFSYKTPGWFKQYYNPYNETDLEAAFGFDYSGKPWRTQAAVRRVLRQNYRLSPNGIPGNNDCGEMTSWNVLSSMGLYPMDPGSPTFVLCTPLFPKITLHLEKPYSGQTLVITSSRNALRKPYIQSLTVNGKAWTHCWIPQKLLVSGAHMAYVLGRKPNRSWGAAKADAPPSISRKKPRS